MSRTARSRPHATAPTTMPPAVSCGRSQVPNDVTPAVGANHQPHAHILSASGSRTNCVCVSYLSSASLSFFFGVMRFIHERDDWPLARANVVNVLSQTTLQMPILASTGLNAFVLWDSDRCPIRSWRRRRGKCPRLWHRRTVVEGYSQPRRPLVFAQVRDRLPRPVNKPPRFQILSSYLGGQSVVIPFCSSAQRRFPLSSM